MTWNPNFEQAFHPRSIAIVGASADSTGGRRRFRPGAGFVATLDKLGYEGRIYPVNPRGGEVFGHPGYTSVLALPEIVDLVVVAVPAPQAPSVLEDCANAGVKNVHVYSAGFSEVGDPEGIELERRITDIARTRGITILGPNCMGLTVPSARISTLHGKLLDSGPVAFISQSGGHCTNFTRWARTFGIGFSKVVSYGNGCIMDSTDLLEYFSSDPETGIICMYLEGVKDGKKLFDQIRRINLSKPVLIWKGGLTESGARAAFSHTGSLAGSDKVWDAFFKQTGAVRVGSVHELTDVAMTFVTMNPPAGRRAAIFAGSGGSSVVAADTCAVENIGVPTLGAETQKRLREFIPVAGSSVANPMDLETIMRNPEMVPRVIGLVSGDPGVDMVLVSYQLNRLKEVSGLGVAEMGVVMLDFARSKAEHKPMASVLDAWEDDYEVWTEKLTLRKQLVQAGMAAYDSIPSMCRAINKYLKYLEFKATHT